MRLPFPSLITLPFAFACLVAACGGGGTHPSTASSSTVSSSTGSTGAGGHAGTGGTAGTGGAMPGTCASDSDCTSGDFCALPDGNDRCLAIPEDCQVSPDDSPCKTDADCGDALSRCTVCPTVTWCTQRCNAGVPCGAGEECASDGRCVLRTCKVNTDCPAQFQCIDTGNPALGVRCVRRTCTSDTQCDGGRCVSGLCFTELGSCDTCN
jgi:hypothetical protein